MEHMIVYRIEIVGGPFDGVQGMAWHDDGEHPAPELILLGICPGDRSCGSRGHTTCAQVRGRKHPYYWQPEELSRPAKVVAYELSDSYVLERGEKTPAHETPGRAIYVIGGLNGPQAKEMPELAGVAAGESTIDSDTPRGRPIHAGYPTQGGAL
jgi:hypothetical protein